MRHPSTWVPAEIGSALRRTLTAYKQINHINSLNLSISADAPKTKKSTAAITLSPGPEEALRKREGKRCSFYRLFENTCFYAVISTKAFGGLRLNESHRAFYTPSELHSSGFGLRHIESQ